MEISTSLAVTPLLPSHSRAIATLRDAAKARGWERSLNEPFWHDDIHAVSPDAAAFITESVGWMEEVVRRMAKSNSTGLDEGRMHESFRAMVELFSELQEEAEAPPPKSWADNLALKLWKRKPAPLAERIASALQEKQRWLEQARKRLGEIREAIGLRDAAETAGAMSVDLLEGLSGEMSKEHEVTKAWLADQPESMSSEYLVRIRRQEALERAQESVTNLSGRLRQELNLGRATSALLDMAHHKEQKILSEMEVALAEQEMHLISLQTITQSLRTGQVAHDLHKTASEQSNQALLTLARMARGETGRDLSNKSEWMAAVTGKGALRAKDRSYLVEAGYKTPWGREDWRRLGKLEEYLEAGGKQLLARMLEEFVSLAKAGNPSEVGAAIALVEGAVKMAPRAFFVDPALKNAYTSYLTTAVRQGESYWSKTERVLPNLHAAPTLDTMLGLLGRNELAGFEQNAVDLLAKEILPRCTGGDATLSPATLQLLLETDGGSLALKILAETSWHNPSDSQAVAEALARGVAQGRDSLVTPLLGWLTQSPSDAWLAQGGVVGTLIGMGEPGLQLLRQSTAKWVAAPGAVADLKSYLAWTADVDQGINPDLLGKMLLLNPNAARPIVDAGATPRDGWTHDPLLTLCRMPPEALAALWSSRGGDVIVAASLGGEGRLQGLAETLIEEKRGVGLVLWKKCGLPLNSEHLAPIAVAAYEQAGDDPIALAGAALALERPDLLSPLLAADALFETASLWGQFELGTPQALAAFWAGSPHQWCADDIGGVTASARPDGLQQTMLVLHAATELERLQAVVSTAADEAPLPGRKPVKP